MADLTESEGNVSKETMNESIDLDESSFDYVADIMSKVKEISNLVTRARLQAKEAEIRAIYSLQFAERAVEEAKSAHSVSESLARTSHVVATLALQITNETDYLIDETPFGENDFSISNAATQTQQNESIDEAKTNASGEGADLEPPSQKNEPVVDGSTNDTFENNDTFSKLQAIYPHDLRTDDMKNQSVTLNRLPVISEENTPKNRGEIKREKTDDAKRRMRLYKDSKLMKVYISQSMEKGDAEALVFEEQTMSVQSN